MIKKLLHHALGMDTSMGILIYVFTTLAFVEDPNVLVLFIALVASHLPDFDIPFYLVLKRRIGPIGPYGANGHWPYGHHPILVIPGAVFVAWLATQLFWPGHELYAMTLVGLAVLAHFIHDSCQEHGLHWLSPFNWTHFAFRGIVPHEVPSVIVKNFYKSQGKALDGSLNREVSWRVGGFGVAQITLLTAALLFLSLTFFLMT